MTKLGHGDLITRARDLVRGLGRRELDVAPRATCVIGHRGAPREAAENTMASFLCALDRGATAVEVDVCVTRDSVWVMWHDPDPREHITVARDIGESLLYVANEPGIGHACRKPISDITFDEFRTHFGYTKRRGTITHLLDGDTKPELPPEPFDALLELDDPRLTDIYIDLKLREDQRDRVAPFVERIASCRRRVHVLSCEREIVEELLACGANAYGDFELPGVVETARELRLRNVSMGAGQRTFAAFRDELCETLIARDEGVLDRVIAWTVNDEERLTALVRDQVDGIITDDPALLSELTRTRGAATGSP